MQLIALGFQRADGIGHLPQLFLFRIGQPAQPFELGKHRLGALQLGAELRLLGGQRFDGGGKLGVAGFDGGDGFIDLRIGGLARAGELTLAGGNLAHGVAQFQLHIGQFRIHFRENGVVERVDAALFDGDIHLLGQNAAGRHARHAVHGFVAGDQFIFNIIGKLQ